MNLTKRLITILSASSLAFLMTGIVINLLFSAPTITILIDRSYCPAERWVQVSNTYNALYRQAQLRQIKVENVILFSHFGQEELFELPRPNMIQTLHTFGLHSPQRQADLQKTYARNQLLSCRLAAL
jgi:hypothetical protein